MYGAAIPFTAADGLFASCQVAWQLAPAHVDGLETGSRRHFRSSMEHADVRAADAQGHSKVPTSVSSDSKGVTARSHRSPALACNL